MCNPGPHHHSQPKPRPSQPAPAPRAEATLGEGDRCGYGSKPSKAKGHKTEKPGRGTGHRCPQARDRREEVLGRSPARRVNASPSPPPPPTGWPSGHPDGHPNVAWETSTATPVPRKATGPEQGKQQKQQNTSPSPVVPKRAWTEGAEEGGTGVGPRGEPVPAPVFLLVYHRGSQETGHTLVTSPNLCPSASRT